MINFGLRRDESFFFLASYWNGAVHPTATLTQGTFKTECRRRSPTSSSPRPRNNKAEKKTPKPKEERRSDEREEEEEWQRPKQSPRREPRRRYRSAGCRKGHLDNALVALLLSTRALTLCH